MHPDPDDEPWPASESCGDEDEPEEEECSSCGGDGGAAREWPKGVCTACGGSGVFREPRY